MNTARQILNRVRDRVVNLSRGKGIFGLRFGVDEIDPLNLGSPARAPGKEHAFMVVAAIVLGIISAYGAIGFRYLIAGFHLSFYGSDDYTLNMLTSMPWWQRLALPTAGGLLVGIIVTRFAPEVKGSGIPEVMEAVAKRGGSIRFRVVAIKALAASITIGSGGSAGREGPIVHIGSAIGSSIGQLFKVSPRRMRTYVACGAAAAIAATFNAPIAGALFALSVVLGDMRVASMSPIVISSVVATVISRHHLGDFPAFVVPAYKLVSAKELVLYGLLGIAAGLIAVVFIRVLFSTSDLFDKSWIPAWMRPAIGGLGVGLIALAIPNVFGVGYETINAALSGQSIKLIGSGLLPPAVLLALLMVAKLLATSLSLGSGGSGGIFAPSLFLGAVLGTIWGQVSHQFFPDWTAGAGAYALVGMGALVSATTHAPIPAILIIFELTNDYRIIPPLMLACVVSVLLSSQLNRESIYTEKLARRGTKLSNDREINLLRAIQVSSVMETEFETVSAQMPLPQLMTSLISARRPAAVAVDDNERYLSMVELSDIREVLPQSKELGGLIVTADVIDTSVPFLKPGNSLDLAMHIFGRTNRQVLAVCDSLDECKVIGVLTRQSVIDTYNRRVFQEDLTGGFGSLIDAVDGGRTVEVLGGVHMAEVDVPGRWIGRTLKDLDIRRKYGVEIMLVHRPVHSQNTEGVEGRPGHFPSPDMELQSGDRLLIMGNTEAIRRMKR